MYCQNHWLFDFADEITDDMNTVFATDFGRKIMTLKEIKKILPFPRKGDFSLHFISQNFKPLKACYCNLLRGFFLFFASENETLENSRQPFASA